MNTFVLLTNEKYNKFVDCAIASNADYIVSQDKHLDILRKIDFPKVNVIRIEDFVVMLHQSP